MKRRLFAKNLAALLAIPFVPKSEEKEYKVIEEVASLEEPQIIEPYPETKFLGDNCMVLQSGGNTMKLQLFEISLESNREDGFLADISRCIKSRVIFRGKMFQQRRKNQLDPIKINKEVQFTVFLNKDHHLEGSGFISEVQMESGGIFEFCIEINGQVLGTYEGDMLRG